MEKKKPAGVLILGIINLVVLGVFQLIFFLIPQDWQAVSKMFKENNININLDPALIKIMVIVQSIMSLIYIISGVGLLRGKNWGRKLALYFAFAVCLVVVLSVLFAPATVSQGVLQVIYPGVIIIYFTNKNVEAYFKKEHELP